MQSLNETPGRTCVIDGKEYLFFSGYAYLGMNCVKAFTDLVKDGIDKYGLLFPSSRISNTRLAIYSTFENLLSNITGSENTACFSSGYLAGKAVTGLFNKIYNAPDSHPAILRSTASQETFEEWADEIVNAINLSREENSVIAADAVNVITATVNDFSFVEHIEKKVTVIIDDSHGIGLIGENGRGICKLVPSSANAEYIFTYSLSKAFGIAGGAVSGAAETISLLRSSPAYTATTSVSPAFIHAFIHAQNYYEQQRKVLRSNIAYFAKLVKELNLQRHSQLPVFVLPGIDDEILLQKNIIISSFAYPNPEGKKVQRIVLNALHTKSDLEYLANVLKDILA